MCPLHDARVPLKPRPATTINVTAKLHIEVSNVRDDDTIDALLLDALHALTDVQARWCLDIRYSSADHNIGTPWDYER